MSKILNATCQGGTVLVDGVPVNAEILSEGQGPSEGVALIEKEKVFYVASNATDIKTTLEKVTNVLTKIGETLTAIGGGMTGPTTAPPPNLATNVAEMNLVIAELTALKDVLK